MPALPGSGIAARLKSAAADEQGQGLLEYALLILLIAIVSIASLTLLGTTLSDLLDTVGNAFP